MNNICNLDLLGLCFVESGSSTETIFGFSEFLAGFALLVIVYTITDFRYKFRVSVAPINLKIITFILIIFIGIGTLVSQLWVAEKWYTVSWNLSQAIWQGIFAFLFLLIITLWMWFAFILPPRFDNFNYRKFSHQIYKTVLRGNLNELDILSDELFSSLPVIIKYANEVNKESDNKEINLYANDMVLLLANRRFCKSLAVNSPSTVLRIFSELSKINIINSSCISILTSNLSSELISNKESQLYHEDEGYYSGLLGYVKPLNSSVYGDYNLVEKLSNQGRSVLDINYKMKMCWDHEQLNIYCQAVLICFESYLKQDKWYQHSFSLYRAISDIKSSIPNLHELNDRQVDFINDNVVNRFQVILDFSKKIN